MTREAVFLTSLVVASLVLSAAVCRLVWVAL